MDSAIARRDTCDGRRGEGLFMRGTPFALNECVLRGTPFTSSECASEGIELAKSLLPSCGEIAAAWAAAPSRRQPQNQHAKLAPGAL